MQIDSARAYLLRMPLQVPWKTSFGAQPDIDTVLVRLRGGGTTGWGEAAPGTWPLCLAARVCASPRRFSGTSYGHQTQAHGCEAPRTPVWGSEP